MLIVWELTATNNESPSVNSLGTNVAHAKRKALFCKQFMSCFNDGSCSPMGRRTTAAIVYDLDFDLDLVLDSTQLCAGTYTKRKA